MTLRLFLASIYKRRLLSYTLRLVCRYGNPDCVRADHQVTEEGKVQPLTRTRKLTDDQVRSIREDKRSAHELALIYGVTDHTIWRVRARLLKAGVPDVAPAAHIAPPSKDEQP